MKVLGIFLCVVGILVGIYTCFWWALVGGILSIIGQVRADEVSGAIVAFSVAKIFFCGAIGIPSMLVFVFPGLYLMDKSNATNYFKPFSKKYSIKNLFKKYKL